jgi:CheY-like chemotaxis protein
VSNPEIDLYDALTALAEAVKYWVGFFIVIAGISVIPYMKYRKTQKETQRVEAQDANAAQERDAARDAAEREADARRYAEYVDNVVTRAINTAVNGLWDDLMKEDSGKSLHDLSKKLNTQSELIIETRTELSSFTRAMDTRVGRMEKQMDMLLPVTMDVSKSLNIAKRWTDPAIVMVVDDDESFAALAKFLLSDSETIAKVLTADRVTDGALKRADVILLDLGLRDTDGMDTLNAMMLLTPNTPIVVMTSDNTIGGEAIRAGAAQYLPKDVLVQNHADARKTLEQVVSLARRTGDRRHASDRVVPLESMGVPEEVQETSGE